MRKVALLLAATALGIPTGARAADPASCATVRMADPGWSDITSTNGVAATLLRALGYRQTVSTLSVPIIFQALSAGQLDVFLGPSIHVGASNVVTARPVPDNLLPLIERHRINSFFAPPTVWIALLRSPLFDRTDLTSLRKGYYGASIMPVGVLRELAQRLPRVRLWNLYGQTEIAARSRTLADRDVAARRRWRLAAL